MNVERKGSFRMFTRKTLTCDFSHDRSGVASRDLVPRSLCPRHGTETERSTTWFHCMSFGMPQVGEKTAYVEKYLVARIGRY